MFLEIIKRLLFCMCVGRDIHRHHSKGGDVGNSAYYGIRKKRVGKRVGKGLADCGKNVFPFPRAVNALSMRLSMLFSDGVQSYPYIHA